MHIKDPEFYNEYATPSSFRLLHRIGSQKLKSRSVFSPRSEFYKASYYYDSFGVPGSIVMITDPHKHKIRRNMLNPLFSARSTDTMSSRSTRIVQRALEIVVTDSEADRAINIRELFRRITVSVSQTFSFAKLSDRRHL